jgi:DNA modification methylase
VNVLDQHIGERGALYHGDCVEVLRGMPDASVHYSISSPPFSSLYTYSASPRDLGNVADHAELFEAFRFLIPEIYRVIKPGRLVSMHCMNLPTSKVRDGVIGLTDFRGELIRAFVECGWVYHSEVVIWKDPVTAMQRTKALGLLHKTIRKDSAMSRQGLPDYLVTFRKPGENPEPIAHDGVDDLPVAVWQRYASPVWVTTRGVDDEGFAVCSGETVAGDDTSSIDPGDTLQHRSAREDEDERHICPLQLEVIRRAIKLWTNPGDTVLSPFAGIGSEIVTAVEMGRRGVGIELKKSYYDQAVRNLIAASVETKKQVDMFATEAP